MIEVLEGRDSIGVFLFFLYVKVGNQAPGFILPAGLLENEIEEFRDEFLLLFGKYAKRWEERKAKIT